MRGGGGGVGGTLTVLTDHLSLAHLLVLLLVGGHGLR